MANDIPAMGGGSVAVGRLAPGKEIYLADRIIYKGGFHESIPLVVGGGKKMLSYPKTSSNHYKNFLWGCKDEGDCYSRCTVSGSLSQMSILGLHYLASRSVGTPTAQLLFNGLSLRKGGEEFYRV